MSTRLIYGEEDRLIPWAAKRIGIDEFRRDSYAIGLERDGEIAAVAVYDSFSQVECSVHLASDGGRRWMNKEFLVAGFAYPFIQCDFKSITGIVPAERTQVLEFNRHLGWVDVGVRHMAAPGGKDYVIMEMLRANCRWIPEEFRK